MTSTAIITAALRILTVVRTAGQTPSSVELSDGLTMLNAYVDSCSTERLLVPVVGSNQYPLSANKASYTIGISGSPDINAPRPLRIDTAGIIQTSYNSGSVVFRRELKIISESEYQAIPDKTSSGDVPEKFYYAPTVPNGTLFFWPTPLVVSGTSVEISGWTPLTQFPDLTTDVPIAPGYDRFLIFNLAVELAPQMPGAVLTQETLASAAEAKRYIMKLNSLMVPVEPDGLIPPATNAEFEPVAANLKAVAQAKFGGST